MLSAIALSMARKVSVQAGACLMAGFALLLIPLPWLLGALLAGTLHELAHVAAVRLLGGQIAELVITPTGARMTAMPMPRGRAALSSLAGPAASLALAAFSEVYPELSVCGIVQGLFNLLPAWPLDGGRIAAVLLSERICRILHSATLLGCFFLSIFLFLQTKIGWLVFYPMGILCIMALRRKIPCKESNLAVQ